MPRIRIAVGLCVVLLMAGCGRDGPAPAPGFDGKTIKLGVLTPLTGPVAAIGRPLTTGGEVYFEWLNAEQGGIAGKYKVELVTEDTAYSADTAIAKYQKIKDGVAFFEQTLGTAITKALLPQLDRDGIVAAPASLDADWVRQPHLLAVGAPYQVQFANAAEWFLKQSGAAAGSRICFAGIANAYGDAGLAGLEFAARTLGVPITAFARYNSGDTNFTGAVTDLRDARCDAVFLATFSGDTSRIVGEAEALQFRPRFFVQATGWDPSLASGPLAEVMARSVTVMGEGTEWGDRNVKGMADLLDRVAKYRPGQAPDYYLVFGYYQAWAAAQVLEKAAARGDFTRAGILKAMEDVGTLRFDGLSGDYAYGSPSERVPPRASSLFSVAAAKPLGLAALQVNLETDTARRYVFP